MEAGATTLSISRRFTDIQNDLHDPAMSRSVIGQFLSPSDLHVWSGHVASLCGLSVTGLILCGPMEVVTQLCALFSAISTISGLPMQSWS